MNLQKYLAHQRVVPHIHCADGFSFSVQASSGHYCVPQNDDGPWTHVEVMADVQLEPILEPYAEVYSAVELDVVGNVVKQERQFTGVCARVPIAVVMLVIHRHGGFSPMMPQF